MASSVRKNRVKIISACVVGCVLGILAWESAITNDLQTLEKTSIHAWDALKYQLRQAVNQGSEASTPSSADLTGTKIQQIVAQAYISLENAESMNEEIRIYQKLATDLKNDTEQNILSVQDVAPLVTRFNSHVSLYQRTRSQFPPSIVARIKGFRHIESFDLNEQP